MSSPRQKKPSHQVPKSKPPARTSNKKQPPPAGTLTSISVKRVVGTRQLDDLIPFPRQEECFDDLTAPELAALADDIKTNGLKHLPEILSANAAGLPRNTIVCGHQRIRAMRLLGRAESQVYVRDDLANATLSELDRVFILDNLSRRQLDKLQQARLTLNLYALEKGRPAKSLRPGELSNARDRVGATIGMSGKHLERYWAILRTPMAVQEAYRRKKLAQVLAVKVASLPAELQAQVAEEIKAGKQTPNEIVGKYVTLADRDRASSEKSRRKLLGGLAHADVVYERRDEFSRHVLEKMLPHLKYGKQRLRMMIDFIVAESTDILSGDE